MADGVPAAHRPRPAVGDLRRGDACRRIAFSARSASARAARSAWDRLPRGRGRQIDAYVAGVNAFIAAHHGRRLPPEFTLLRFEPEPWTGPDVLVWVKMMAWDLSANYSLELLRHDIAAKVGPSACAELLPPYPSDGLSIVWRACRSLRSKPHRLRSSRTARRPTQSRPAAAWTAAFARELSRRHPVGARLPAASWSRRRRSARTTGSWTAR